MPRRLLYLVLLASLPGCGGGTPDTSPRSGDAKRPDGQLQQDVVLQLNWFPEAEHGGYYAALVHGFFQNEGLNTEIRPGGPSVPVLTQVASGRVDFGIANAHQVLMAQAQEADVVAVFAPLQTSPRCVMVHRSSGIEDWHQLSDVTLAMNSSSVFSLYLQKKLPLSGVRIVPYAGNVANFLLDERHAQQAYVFSEPFVVQQRGISTNCLMVSDLGFNPYTSLLIASRETIRQRPDLVRRMVAAVQLGCGQYLEQPARTNQHLSKVNHDMDVGVLDYGAAQLRDLCQNDQVPLEQLGDMSLDRWQTLASQLEDVQAVRSGTLRPSAAFDLRFLDAAGASPTATDSGIP